MSFLADVDQLKVLTVSRKSERLVNLTIALLATKKWIPKSQIFTTVEGYEGEPDAMERMFERDKDELRKLGIIIEVGTFDPLFEDEVGYRIRPDDYRCDLDSLTAIELSLISQATQLWKGAVLDTTALSALVKLKSLGIDSDLDSLPGLSPRISVPEGDFVTVLNAISTFTTISFSYTSIESTVQSRVIEPYGAGTKGGRWYVAGRDVEKDAVRLFRLDRIVSKIELQGRPNSYIRPTDFSMTTLLRSPEKKLAAKLKIRRGKAHKLRSSGEVIEDGDEWTIIRYPYSQESELVEDVLWHLDDAVILEPISARESICQALKQIVKNHG